MSQVSLSPIPGHQVPGEVPEDHHRVRLEQQRPQEGGAGSQEGAVPQEWTVAGHNTALFIVKYIFMKSFITLTYEVYIYWLSYCFFLGGGCQLIFIGFL